MKRLALAAWLISAGITLGGPAAEARQHRPRQAPSEASSETDLRYLVSRFRVLSPTAQVGVVQAIRDFMEAWEYANSKGYAAASPDLRTRMGELASSLAGLFADTAWGEDFDCLFGGWASRQSGGKCLSPSRSNPAYQKLFQSARCDKDGFLCSPAMFGKALCLEPKEQVAYNPNQTVNPEKTRDLIRSTYQSCKTAANKRKLEDIVKDIAEDPEAYAILEATGQAMEQACDKPDHFQFGSDMCNSAKVRLAAVKKEFFRQYPDQIAAGQCYLELDQIRKCAVQLPDWAAPGDEVTREWTDLKAKEGKPRYWGCGYFENFMGSDFAGILAFRDPDSDAVYIRSPSRSWFQGDKFPMTEHLLYKMPGAKLNEAEKPSGVRDVQQLAGVLPSEVAKLGYFDNPAPFKDVYRAMLNEITQQMKERAAEYAETTKAGPNPALRKSLSGAVRGCADVDNSGFQKARAEACKAIGLPIADCKPTGGKGASSKGNRAN